MVTPPKEVCDELGRKDARWYSTTGLTKESLYKLHRFRSVDTLIVVEGYLDALYLSEFGLPVVAVGKGPFLKVMFGCWREPRSKRLFFVLIIDFQQRIDLKWL